MMSQIRIFIGFGNVYSSLPNLSKGESDRINAIFVSIGRRLAEIDCTYLFAGRSKAFARVVCEEMANVNGNAWAKKHIHTYLPDLSLRNELPKDSYVEIGKVLRKGDWIEDRREQILCDADVVLLSGGGRGTSQYPNLAKCNNKFVIPLPIGKGPIEKLYSEFINRFENSCVGHEVISLGDQSATPDEVADAYISVINAVLNKQINQAQAFLAMPFVKEFEERDDAEDVLFRVCKDMNIDLVVAKDTDGQSSLIAEILEGIENTSFLVAYLDENRPNVYFESGYAKGLGKPVIFCHKSSRMTSFDTNNFENIHWNSFRDLETKLTEKITNLRLKGLIP